MAALIAYYIFTQLTHIGIPCVFRVITGKYCPGCGVSRMCVSLIKGDFYGAFRYNMLVLLFLPFMLIFGIRRVIGYVLNGESRTNKVEAVFVTAAAVLTVAFWIMRNTEAFSYLAPIAV